MEETLCKRRALKKAVGLMKQSLIMRATLLSLLFSLFIVFSSSNSNAENLLEVYKLSKKEDPRFAAAQHLHKSSREKETQAYASLYPTVSLSGQYSNKNQDIKSSDNTLFGEGDADSKDKEYTFAINQPIFRYTDIVRLKQAKAEMSKADAEHEEAKQELLLRVSELYFGALAAKDSMEYVGAELAAVEVHYQTAEARNRARLAPITDLYDARARLATVTANKIESENKLEDAIEALKETCGSYVEDFSFLTEELPLLPPVPSEVKPWIKLANEENKSLLIQRYNVEAAEKEIKRLKAGHYPTLDLALQYNYRDTDGSLFGGASEVETKEALLQLNIPLYQGGMVSSKTKEAIETHMAASKVFEQQARAVTREARAAYNGIKTAISKVNALKQALASQELALNAKQEGFKSGLYASLAVLDAERDYYFAKRDLSQAKYDYVLNTLRLKKAVGVLQEEDLAKVNDWLK